MIETQQATVATHILESQGQASSVFFEHSKPLQLLTNWKNIISMLEIQQATTATAATHSMESQAQASSVCLIHSKQPQPLTL